MRKLLAIVLAGLIVPLLAAHHAMAEQAWTTGGTENYVAKYSSSISTLTASSLQDNGVLVNVLGADGVKASTFTSLQNGFVAGGLYTNIRSYFRMVGTAAFWGYNAYPGPSFWELNSTSRSGSIIYQRMDDYPSGGAYNGHTVMQWTQITSTHTTNEMMTWDWNTGQMCLGLGHNASNPNSLCRGKLSVGGNVNVSTGYGYLVNGSDINTAGTLSNVAYKNQANIFTAQQTVKAPLLISSTDNSNGLYLQSSIAPTHYNWRVSAQTSVDGAFEVAPSTGIGSQTWGTPTFYASYNGDFWINQNCSAESFTDRTPYPESLQEAYAAVQSMQRKSSGGIEHSRLHPFIRSEIEHKLKTGKTVVETGRDLSATVSAQNEVIKDLIKRIAVLEAAQGK